MSVDERLSVALRDQADSFTPQVETALERVRARGRAERWRSATVAIAASAAAVAAIAAAVAAVDVAGVGDVTPADRPTAPSSGTATASPGAPLRVSVTGDVTRPDALAGRWTLRLNGNGTIDVSPPARFNGEVSRPLFTADETSFRTTLFQDDRCTGHGTGIYSWLRVGDQIDFQRLSDTCAARDRFFADSTWTMSTGENARD